MLMKHTPEAVAERTSLSINPAKTCMPIGAMYAALGVHACLPHSHGSQGCCAYHRSMLTRHFREPVMAATSSFTEGSSVFGGQSNLLAAIENIFTIYNPTVIGVHTTCLSETIGDDMNQIIIKARDEGKIPEGKYVFHANTPSYVGSHVTGFARMTKAMVDYYSEHNGTRNETINLIPGWVEPSDIRELKRLVAEMKVECITFPDQSDVFDTPQTGKMNMYPKGGVTVPRIKAAGNSEATIGLGPTASGMATEALETKCKVPGQLLELPVGLRATDRFIAAL
ncbi:MAG TPA: nitrogenase component 1, partial [Candidatus Methylomirabilis sp.]|nr:nitrogenase component 1 [Candidatus Methylomirabilis sp.]